MGFGMTLYDFIGNEIEVDNPLPMSIFDASGNEIQFDIVLIKEKT